MRAVDLYAIATLPYELEVRRRPPEPPQVPHRPQAATGRNRTKRQARQLDGRNDKFLVNPERPQVAADDVRLCIERRSQHRFLALAPQVANGFEVAVGVEHIR